MGLSGSGASACVRLASIGLLRKELEFRLFLFLQNVLTRVHLWKNANSTFLGWYSFAFTQGASRMRRSVFGQEITGASCSLVGLKHISLVDHLLKGCLCCPCSIGLLVCFDVFLQFIIFPFQHKLFPSISDNAFSSLLCPNEAIVHRLVVSSIYFGAAHRFSLKDALSGQDLSLFHWCQTLILLGPFQSLLKLLVINRHLKCSFWNLRIIGPLF